MKPTTLLHWVSRQGYGPFVAFLLWEPRDLWVGIYWNKVRAEYGHARLDVYVCVLPMLPIRLCYYWRPNDRVKGEPVSADGAPGTHSESRRVT